ncbi:MAG: 6-oxocyclohex-1-ene-1-carbonyl-CoA hydratase [Acidobacteriota bacterium]
MKNHEIVDGAPLTLVRYETRPAHDAAGTAIPDLHHVWIWLDNPAELNSYTTDTLKELIVAFRRASCDRACVSVVLTGKGDRAFCSGGNTREYAEVYAGRPHEYRQYMRLFNDAVTSILQCDKPVICRVNGLRVAGGQELGMACDFTVAQDLAVFGQAGPRHGSAPDGGATDFLPLFTGIERAMESVALCEPWSAHKAYRLGLLTAIVPALKVDGRFVANPRVVTDRVIDEHGRFVLGETKTGPERAAAEETVRRGEIDLALLDAEVARLADRFVNLMPECVTKTLESLRKHKLLPWDRNRETNRAWLALNMMGEAKAGFRAFHEGPKGAREVDFVELRRSIARGEPFTDDVCDRIQPGRRVPTGSGT